MADQSTLSDLSQRIGVLMENLGEKLRQFASAGTMPDDHAEKAKEMHAKAETIRAKLPEGEGVAGEIERDNVIVFGEEWGDEGKAARVGEKAMCHKHFRLAAVAPAKVMHFSIVDLHITFLARHFQGRHKPFRQMRTISSPDGADIVGKNCHFG